MGERRNVAIVHRRHARHAARRAAGISRRRSVIGPDLPLHSLARFLAKTDERKNHSEPRSSSPVDIAIARHELTTNWRHLPSQMSGTRLLQSAARSICVLATLSRGARDVLADARDDLRWRLYDAARCALHGARWRGS